MIKLYFVFQITEFTNLIIAPHKHDDSGRVRVYLHSVWTSLGDVLRYSGPATTRSDSDDLGVRNSVWCAIIGILTTRHKILKDSIAMARFIPVRSFFWIFSLFFASVIRVMVPPLKDEPFWSVLFAVIFQEFFRYVYYRLLK